MSPTLAEALGWRPSELGTRAGAARAAADSVMGGRGILADGREALEASWTGVAADAAGTAVAAEIDCAAQLVTAIDALEAVIGLAAHSLDGARTALEHACRSAVADGYEVDPDGAVRPGPVLVRRLLAGGHSADAAAFVAAGAGAHAERIAEALVFLRSEDARHGEAVRAATETLLADAVPPAPSGPATLQLARRALADGLATEADIALATEALTGIGVTPEVLAALAAGHDAPTLPAGAMDALEGFYGHDGARGLLDTRETLSRSPHPGAQELSRTLSGGMLVLSQERARDASGATGGYSRMPADLRRNFEYAGRTPTPEQWRQNRTPAERRRHEDDPAVEAAEYRAETQRSLGNSVGAGEDRIDRVAAALAEAPGVPAGDELSRRLVVAVSDSSLPTVSSPDGRPWDDGTPRDDLGGPALALASRNHEALHDVLRGEVEGARVGGPDTPAEQRRRAVLEPLLHRDWADGGAPVVPLVDWMSDDLRSDDPAVRLRAGEAADGLVAFLSDHDVREGLLDIQGPYSQTLGETNPAVTRGLVRGLDGVLEQFAESAVLVPGWDPEHTDVQRGRDVMSVLASDDGGREATAAVVRREVDERLAAVAAGERHLVASDPDLVESGRLRGMLDGAVADVTAERATDLTDRITADHENQGAGRGVGFEVAKLLPFSIGDGIGLLQPIVEALVEPEDPKPDPAVLTPSGDPAVGQELARELLRHEMPDLPPAAAPTTPNERRSGGPLEDAEWVERTLDERHEGTGARVAEGGRHGYDEAFPPGRPTR